MKQQGQGEPERGRDNASLRRNLSHEERLKTWWPELRGRVPEQWSRLENSWLDEIDGRYDRLSDRLRDAYGISEQEANRQVDDFVETHWSAISAGALAPHGKSAGEDRATTTPASPSKDTPRDRRDIGTSDKLAGGNRIGDDRADDSGVGTGTLSPGGRDI